MGSWVFTQLAWVGEVSRKETALELDSAEC